MRVPYTEGKQLGGTHTMNSSDDYFNSLSFEQRGKLSPVLTSTRVRTLLAVRDILVRQHKRTLKEIDDWIENLNRGEPTP